MTRLLISTTIAGLLVLGGTAMAQPDDHRQAGHAAADARGRAAQTAQPAPAPQAAQAARPAGGGAGHDRRPSAAAPAAPAAQPAAAPQAQRPGPGMRGPDNAMRAPNDNAMRGRGNAMRGNPGQRRDFSSYQRNFNAPNHFHAAASYRRPGGWYSHRWTYGEILPSLFWAPDYWLSDYNDFGLMSPPPGTVWVRDGNDALLIDRDSGEIIQVEYSVFY
jgi:Ni/Co efflux regulator RcnB